MQICRKTWKMRKLLAPFSGVSGRLGEHSGEGTCLLSENHRAVWRGAPGGRGAQQGHRGTGDGGVYRCAASVAAPANGGNRNRWATDLVPFSRLWLWAMLDARLRVNRPSGSTNQRRVARILWVRDGGVHYCVASIVAPPNDGDRNR
jgi:hypothetical protein